MQGCAEAHGEDAVDSPCGFWFLIPGFLCHRVCCTLDSLFILMAPGRYLFHCV